MLEFMKEDDGYDVDPKDFKEEGLEKESTPVYDIFGELVGYISPKGDITYIEE